MHHHMSWFSYFPLYQKIYVYLNYHYSSTIIFNSGLFPKDSIINTLDHVVASLFTSIIICILTIYTINSTSTLTNTIIPQKYISMLNIIDFFYESVVDFTKSIMGDECKNHSAFVASIACYIFICNIMGLVPGLYAATSNLNTTLACGVIVFFYFNYWGVRVHGIGHFTHLANPIGAWWGWFLSPLMLLIESIGLCIRPFSLAIRLAGNLIGDHSVILTFAGFMPILIPLPFMAFGFLVCIIQTFIFCLLTCVYIHMHTDNSH